MIAHVRSVPEPLVDRPRAVPATLTIAVDGPMGTSESLAIVNRAFTDALARLPGVSAAPGRPGLSTTHTIRNMYPPRLDAASPGVRTFFYFAWEDSRIPAEWARAFNSHFDGLLVPSAHVRDVVARSGVAIPVAVVPYGVDGSLIDDAVGPEPSPLTRKTFRFLHVSTGFSRKGCDVLIRAFVREFSSRDDVALIVKTLPQYDHSTARLVRRARWLHLRCSELVHVDRDLDDVSMQQLYRTASCLVHPARAEGFGLPIAEAMLAGVPVIATDYSGHADFCTEATAVLVPCRLTRSRSPFVVADAEWGEPDEAALRQAMRQAYEHRDDAASRRRVAAARAHMRTFTWSRAAERAAAFMRTLDVAADTPLRVGMLTTWQERCGIAEYSRQLIDAIADPNIEWTILAPHRADDLPAPVDGHADTSVPGAIRCWSDDWPVDPVGAVNEARRLGLDAIHVQTHLNGWTTPGVEALARLSSEGRRVLMTLHSVRGAQPTPDVVRWLAAIDRILVHTEDDSTRLRALGLESNVTVLPQGYPTPADEAIDAARVRLGLTDAGPIVGTYGFLRPHKGVMELIQAVARMRRRYPRLALLAVTALYPSQESSAYLAQCQAEAARQGLADRCHFVTDFLAPDSSVAALQACDVIALPYHPAIDSSSAAVRMALASRRPVVTTAVPVFAEVTDAVHAVPKGTPRALARGLTRVLEDPLLRERLANAASRRLEDESWAMVGQTYRKLLRTTTLDVSAFREPYPVTPS